MDNELRIIQYLYGEEDDPAEVETALDDNPSLQRELNDHQAVKEHLDARAADRPDAEVIDRIMEAAAAPHAHPPRSDREPDRAAARPARSKAMRRGLAGALAVVLLGIGAVLVSPDLANWTESDEPADEAAVVTDDDAPSLEDDPLPAWDEGDQMVRMQGYIDALQSRSSASEWGTTSTSLQPTSGSPNGR